LTQDSRVWRATIGERLTRATASPGPWPGRTCISHCYWTVAANC